MKRAGTRTLVALTLLGAVAQVRAQTGHAGHAGHSMGGVSTGMSMQAMSRQMVSALRPLRGRAFDLKFAQLMMDHHQMALDMAGQELGNGKDARVRAEAQKVITAQKKEIALMTGWVRKWTGKVYVPQTLPMVLTGTVNTDRWFLTEMIPHHQGAVDMSRLAADRSGSSEVKKLALSIIRSQTAEMNTYRQLLKTVK